MKYDVYLQGSYANATNIRGNSDVDVVVELTGDGSESLFYSDLTAEEKRARRLGSARYSFTDIRREVIAALSAYYGSRAVDATGPNAVAVTGSDSRLKADVLPCVTYRRYASGPTAVEGVRFWNQHTNQATTNFPKIHIDNGSTKNSDVGTHGRYKPSVRIFKNARERIIDSSEELRRRYPSYFVECLLYNVPNSAFVASSASTYVQVVNFLHTAFTNRDAEKFTTQSRQQYLFGPLSTQWSFDKAKNFVADLVTLWNR